MCTAYGSASPAPQEDVPDSARGAAGRRARVSPAARACLGDGPGWWLARHTVTMFLSRVVAVCVYLIGFLEVRGPG